MKSLAKFVFSTALSLAASLGIAQERGSRVWIERPWEFRYIMQILSPDDYELGNRMGKEWLAEGKVNDPQELEAIFPLTTAIATDPEHYRGEDKAIGAVLITFNEQGEVTSRYDWPHKLSGHISRIRSMVLTPGNGPQDMQFLIGYWYTGRSSDELAYIPAICTLHDYNTRYKKGYFADKLDRIGNFGCREWGYSLQSDKIPYIDVTSYGKDKSTYIRPVIGWGRFDTPPKPVIGKHGKFWVCLHECPNGEAPSIIPNIRLWAARNGWPEPKPPKKLPMFPDPDYKHGESLD